MHISTVQPADEASDPLLQLPEMSPEVIIVGVDVGLTDTGVAFSTTDMEEPHVINRWPGTLAVVYRVPTTVCYRAGMKGIKSWGFGCPSPGSIGRGEEVMECFKLHLDPKVLRSTLEEHPEYAVGELEDVRMWFVDFLTALYNHTAEFIGTYLALGDWDSSQVEYIFSVPTTWKDPAVVEAFKTIVADAGFGKPKAHHAVVELTEAEAIAVYTTKSSSHQQPVSHLNGIPEPNGEPPTRVREGHTLLICDSGGGTIDISVLKVISVKSFEEFKGEKVDIAEFEQLGVINVKAIGSVEQAFQAEVERRLNFIHSEDEYYHVLEFAAEEMSKTQFQPIKATFGEMCAALAEFGLLVPGLPENFSHAEAGIERGRLIFTQNHIREMFDTQVVHIFGAIDNQLGNLQRMKPSEKVSHFILLGGLCSSRYVQDCILKRYSPDGRDTKVLVPEDPRLAVCKGLVIDRIQRLKHRVLFNEPYDKKNHSNQRKPPRKGLTDRKEYAIDQGQAIKRDESIGERFHRITEDPNTTSDEDIARTQGLICELDCTKVDLDMDNMSIRSLNSINLDGSTLRGSSSGQSSSASTLLEDTAKEQLFAVFAQDDVLQSLYREALQRRKLGRNKFERNFCRLIKIYCCELRQLQPQGRETQNGKVIGLIMTQRRQFASRISTEFSPINIPQSKEMGDLKMQKADKRFLLERALAASGQQKNTLPERVPSEIRKATGIRTRDCKVTQARSDEFNNGSDSDGNLTADNSDNDYSEFPNIDHVRRFLIAGAPFQNLRNNLRQFVCPSSLGEPRRSEKELDHAVLSSSGSVTQVLFGFGTTLWDKLYEKSLSVAETLQIWERPLDAGKQRVRWSCSCRRRLYDDYIELRPGALEELERCLNQDSGPRSQPNGSSYFRHYGARIIASLRSTIITSYQVITNFGRSPLCPDDRLPTHNTPDVRSSSEPGRSIPPTEMLYLLLCTPNGRYGTDLHHRHVVGIKNDRKLFLLLREHYSKKRTKLQSSFSMRTVQSINLVKFLVDMSGRVDVKRHLQACDRDACTCVPPPEKVLPACNGEYKCRPIPTDWIPPVGENYIMHYYHNPSCVDDAQTWVYNQFPKRCREQLVGQADSPSLGWGVHFEEGWHWDKFWCLGLVLFVAGSLIFGVLWAVLKKDIQSAFAISSYWITALSIIFGYLARNG